MGMNIGFLVPWPLNADLTAYWVLWATTATAVGTFLLAYFAFKAWGSAKETLEGQEKAMVFSALAEYVRSLNALARLSHSAPASYLPAPDDVLKDSARYVVGYRNYVNELCHEVEVAGAMWRIHHREQDSYHSILFLAEKALLEAQRRRISGNEGDDDEDDSRYDSNSRFADDMVFWVKHYQTRETDRKSLLIYIKKKTEKFSDDSGLTD